METAVEILVALLLVVAGTFGLIGSFGLVRLRDAMQRLHAPTKATTIGVGAALVASVIDLYHYRAALTWQELLVAAFLFITAPITALFLARIHMHRSIPRKALPPTGTAQDWATFDARIKDADPDI
ncbi:Na+/H+ antiporter subunit G [Cereibacter sphaeroides]|uniref:Na+/H+ antiporter subunit G n=1 Tax=Cereibacter sphaeroides TaxID=1063 RepID=UPI001F3A312A|nr:Na+/H+ antiporter subunit G [Cereibacter sphaeroides]MCE6951206.1 Na+/H+ antiporter subunit G [Cereibacter sphaeroides]